MTARGEPWSDDAEAAFRAPIREQYETQGRALYSTARLWDDGIIEPTDTRMVVGLALAAAGAAPLEPVGYGVFRM
jgi:3-methylcrotonyl-CoA carboxylase beta subunit